MEGLLRPNNRSFLEALLKELTGTDWTLKLRLAEGLPPTARPDETQPEAERAKSEPNDALDSFNSLHNSMNISLALNSRFSNRPKTTKLARLIFRVFEHLLDVVLGLD